MEWILIVYLVSWKSGGPTAITFPTEMACHAAHQTIKKEMQKYYSGGICINKSTGSK